MQKIVRLFIVCVALFLVGGGVVSAQRVKLPPVTRVKLDNGIQVVLMESHKAPTVQVIALLRGGSVLDPVDRAGVAALTATLLRKGTESRTATQIAEEIETLGGSLDTSASDDRLGVTLSVLSKDTVVGLDLLADVLRHPTFPGEELERERQLEISGLQAIGENPGAVAGRVANEAVYGSHPYGLDATVTSLKAITREDIRGYYDRVFAPNRMILVAVGDFRTAELLGQLKSKFGDMPVKSDALPVTPSVPAWSMASRKLVLIDKPDATQTQVRWVRTAFPRSSADYFPALVAESILGGGFTSRLVNEIRVNRSLTYGISSHFVPQRVGGDFVVSTFTKVETTKALLDATNGVLRDTAVKGFTAGEVQKFKSYMIGQFAIQVQSPEALAGQLANIAFYELPNDYLETYLVRLRSVTLADANRVARTYFQPGSLSLVLVAPAAKVKGQLSGLTGLETRPVEGVGK